MCRYKSNREEGVSMPKSSEIAAAMNKKAILNLLRKQGPMSKADIARELGLSFPAVSYNTKKLLTENSVYEVGVADNALGRKGTLLAFNSRKAYLVGVDIGRNNIRSMCSDIGGEILSYNTKRIQNSDTIQQVIEMVYSVVKEAGVDIMDVRCIGLGVPGIYDSQRDTLKSAPFAEEWSKQPIIHKLEKEFHMAIIVENSVNLGVIGERWKGSAYGYDNILYVDFGVGIGAATIIDGNLVKGKNGALGEIAYMVLDKDRLSTSFFEEGALERLIPSRYIGEVISELNKEGKNISIREVFNRIEQMEKYPHIHDTPTYFAMALVNAILMSDPELLVISGRLGCAIYDAYKKQIDDIIAGNVPFLPIIKCTQLAEKASVFGAIAFAMRQFNRDNTEIHS